MSTLTLDCVDFGWRIENEAGLLTNEIDRGSIQQKKITGKEVLRVQSTLLTQAQAKAVLELFESVGTVRTVTFTPPGGSSGKYLFMEAPSISQNTGNHHQVDIRLCKQTAA